MTILITTEEQAAAMLQTKVSRLRHIEKEQKEKAAGGFKASDLRMNTPRIQRGKQRQVEQESVGRH